VNPPAAHTAAPKDPLPSGIESVTCTFAWPMMMSGYRSHRM